MEVSISTGLYYKKGYKEILDIIASTSCHNIELFLNQAFIDVNINELYIEVAKRKLNILSIHTPLEFYAFPRKESEEYWINRSIEIAKVFGSQLIVSHMVMGEYFEEIPCSLDEFHKHNIVHYRGMQDICITTENLPQLENGSFLGRHEELYDFVSRNDISMTFDTTHCAFSGSPIIDTFMRFRNHIKNIHLSDFDHGIEHKVFGDGCLPIREFLDQLKTVNYDGLITIEYDFDNKKRNDIQDNEQAIAAIQNSIDIIKATLW